MIPRAEVAREILPEQLRKLGAMVDVIPVYRTIAPAVDAVSLTQQFHEGQVAAITFTSSSTVRNFVELFGGRDAVRPFSPGWWSPVSDPLRQARRKNMG